MLGPFCLFGISKEVVVCVYRFIYFIPLILWQVTGSNKGIGFGIVKGLCEKFSGVVYLTSRDENRGQAAVAELNKVSPSIAQFLMFALV